jgi:tetratricopeptide (TPR) repeat protein
MNGRVRQYIFGGWQLGIETSNRDSFTPGMGDTSTLNSEQRQPDIIGNPTVTSELQPVVHPAAFTAPGQYYLEMLTGIFSAGPACTSRLVIDEILPNQGARQNRDQAEAFNAFNHTNLSNPNSTVDSSTAGQIFGISDIMRRYQLSATIRFYGQVLCPVCNSDGCAGAALSTSTLCRRHCLPRKGDPQGCNSPPPRRRIEANSAPAHNYYGFALGQEGAVDQAIEEFRKALRSIPATRMRFTTWAALTIQNQYTAAIQNLQAAVALAGFPRSAV